MEGCLSLLGGGGGREELSPEGSTNGSISTVSKADMVEKDYVGLSPEVSSYPNEAELELGLGLSLGTGMKAKPCVWREYGRILTAKDFPSMISRGSSASSSSPSPNRVNASTPAISGTKRAADSVAQDSGSPNGVSQVVGWPPIRAYRMNSLASQAKSSTIEEDTIVIDNVKNQDKTKKKANNNETNINGNIQEKGYIGKSLFVKVNMDGVAIGRKVDLSAHSCYETLAQTLEDMFQSPTITANAIRSNVEKEHGVVVEPRKSSKLLDGSSEFVLTYEDKDGDWMLVGDVPWRMFLNTVKRLRIMRTSEVNGLAPRFQEKNERQRSTPI